MSGSMKVFLVLLLVGCTHGQGSEGDSQCVSREEFDRVSTELDTVTAELDTVTAELDRVNAKLLGIKDELDVWQETTIDILKRYLLENRELPGASSCNTTAEPGLAGSLSQLQTDVQDIQQQVVNTINNNSLSHEQQQQELQSTVGRVQETLHGIQQQVSTINNNSVPGPLLKLLGKVTQELSEIKTNQRSLLTARGTFQDPAISCHYTAGSHSGYYWIQSSSAVNGTTLQYCDMARHCCNSTGGWMRVADIDMADPTQHCPPGFRNITSPKRTCGGHGSGCVSTTFPVHGVQYSRVCGRIIAYQFGSPNAFYPYYFNRQLTLDGVYVEGVSLTHGRNPRKHIWTFAAALDEIHSNSNVCPCTKTDSAYTGVVPPFIGQDYFCDTGSRYRYQLIFYPDDPLWDGAGCGGTSTCCTFNNPPWFCKQLPQPTTDDIELRLCTSQSSNNEDARFEIINLYVQ